MLKAVDMDLNWPEERHHLSQESILTLKLSLTMSGLLENSTSVDQRSVICLLVTQSEKPLNIHFRMTKVYSESSMNQGHFWKWA